MVKEVKIVKEVKLVKDAKIVKELNIGKEVTIVKEVKIIKELKIVKEVKRSDSLRRYACGDVSFMDFLPKFWDKGNLLPGDLLWALLGEDLLVWLVVMFLSSCDLFHWHVHVDPSHVGAHNIIAT